MFFNTTRFRNFFGALLGGALGILLCGYIHPLALPFGCLVGCIAGYWFDYIWVSVVHAFDVVEVALDRFNSRPGEVLRSWARLAHGAWESFLGHPLERAELLRTFAAWVFLLLHFCAFAVCLVLIRKIGGDASIAALIVTLIALGFAALAVVANSLSHNLASSDDAKKKTLAKMRIFYATWERYGDGGLGYVLLTLGDLFRTQLGIFLYIAGSLSWFVVAGGLFLLAVVAPAAAAMGFVRGVYYASHKDGYWFCFAVTLAITVLSAWLMYPNLQNGYTLWLAALSTGVASAVATDLAKQALQALFATSRTARSLVVVSRRYRSSWVSKGFWSISSSLNNLVVPGLEKILPPLLR